MLISDDHPRGRTLDVVKSFLSDDRVRYLIGPQKGIDKNKQFLLEQCSGDAVFLCDQDDVWLPGKVEKVTEQLENGACCVMHDAYITDEYLNKTGETLFENRRAAPGLLKNIFVNSYTGCCMALTRRAFEAALPFPENIPMHDQWLGLVSERIGKVVFLDEPLILWRRNPGSATGGKTTVVRKLKWRFDLIKALLNFSFEGNDDH